MTSNLNEITVLELLEPRVLLSAGGLLAEPFDSAVLVDVIPADTVPVAGEIPSAGESQMYRFTAPAIGKVWLNMNAQSGGLDPVLTVYNEAGRPKGSNDNASSGTLNSQIKLSVKNGQVYYVLAAGNADSTGQYKLSFTSEPKDDFGNTLGAAKALRLRRGKARSRGRTDYDGDVDFFSLVTANACQMTITLAPSGRNSLFAGEAILYDGQGNEVSARVKAGQTYYIEVRGSFTGSSSNDRYKLDILAPVDKIGNTIAQATDVRMRRGKGKAKDSIDFDWDVDVWRAVTTSAAPMTLQLTPKGRRSNFNGELYVYNSQGTEIAHHDDPQSGAVLLSADTVAGGTYYIKVASADGSVGKYGLTVICPVDDHGDTRGDATVISQRRGGGRARGSLDFLGDVDMFSMASPVSGQMQVRFSGSGRSNTINPEVTVSDSVGGLVAHSGGYSAGGAAEISFDVEQSATYYILVGDADEAALGKYNLNIATTEAPPQPVSPVTLQLVDNSASAKLSGHVTQDIVFDTATDWLSAQLRVTLTSGSVYQDAYGGVNSPSPVWFAVWPSVEFDSYVSNGVLGESVATLAAVNLGGGEQFDDSGISIGWNTLDKDDIGSLALARISLSDDAAGTWQFRTTSLPAAGQPITASGTIFAGTMLVTS